jgi:hypothetical protein
MAITGLEHWYDGQQRRFLEQVIRAFSGWQYTTGRRNGEEPELRMVPCRLASHNRMVGHIMRNNSENTLISCPLITVWQEGLGMRRQDMQDMSHVDTRSVHERGIDSVTGEYNGEAGNRYTVRRLMPRPFEMAIRVDIWTSNLDQKHQLSEQMLPVFFPDITIQNSDNPLDWSARTTLNMEDIQWSSKTIPIGNAGEDEIDVMTFQFKLPMWIAPPAEVTSEKVIQQISVNIYEGDIRLDPEDSSLGDSRAEIVVTPGNHRVEVDAKEGTLKLLGPKGGEIDDEGNVYRWSDLVQQYGTLRPTISKVHIKRDLDIESDNEVIGVVQYDGLSPNILRWTVDVDTLPTNTLAPIRGVIDPMVSHPLSGLTPTNGDRYLLLNDIGTGTQAWGSLSARENDIIVFQNGVWSVVFNSATTTTVQHVLNLHSARQLRWTGDEWVLSVGGDYGPGYWRLWL